MEHSYLVEFLIKFTQRHTEWLWLDYSVTVMALEMSLVEKCEFFVKGFILLILGSPELSTEPDT